MRRLCTVAIWAGVVSAGVTCGQASSGQTTQPATEASMASPRLMRIKTAEVLRVAREAALMKDLGVKDAGDVLKVQIAAGRILPATAVEPPMQGARFTLRGSQGIVEMTAMGPPMPGLVGGGGGFTFIYQDASRTDNVMTTLQVLSSALITQFNITDDGLERTQSVQLIEQARPGPQAISLRVDDVPSEWSDVASPAGPKIVVNVAAGSFEQLRAEHRSEVDQYVRPMFRLLGQEAAVFAVDRATAWQVMADAFVVDPAVQKKIEDILPRLGADAFAARDAASDELAATGVEGAMTLRKMSLGKLSAEQQNRIETFLRPFTSANVKGLENDRQFLIDCLYADDAKLRGAVLKRLSDLAGRKIEWKAVDSDAARDAEIEAFRDAVVHPTTMPMPTGAGGAAEKSMPAFNSR